MLLRPLASHGLIHVTNILDCVGVRPSRTNDPASHVTHLNCSEQANGHVQELDGPSHPSDPVKQREDPELLRAHNLLDGCRVASTTLALVAEVSAVADASALIRCIAARGGR